LGYSKVKEQMIIQPRLFFGAGNMVQTLTGQANLGAASLTAKVTVPTEQSLTVALFMPSGI
jgi:hypothetical protein